MSALSDSFLDAISAISEKSVKASNATLTIECTITEVEDAGLQIYKVNYKDNIFNATSSSGSYNVGDIVYVLVPEGDFSKPKMILGAVVPSSANLAEEETTDDYIKISENLLGNINEVKLCSYKPIDEIIEIEDFKNKILYYLNNNYRNFIFSMYIKTNLDIDQQLAGNYGLWLYLPTLVDDGKGETKKDQVILNMDINSILGNPYRLINFAYQETRYTFPDNVTFDETRNPYLKKIVNNFPNQSDDKPNDIFIKDISFSVIDILTAEQKEGYYFTLRSKTSPCFQPGSDPEKIIEPELKIKGRASKIDTDKQDCYQFVEDSSIDSSSPYYSYIAGRGQKCLNDLNLETSQYVTNILFYSVKKEDVISEVRYRCSLVNISEQIQKDAYIIISNKSGENLIECSLTTEDNIITYPKDMGNVNLIARVEGLSSDSERIDLNQRLINIDTEKELTTTFTAQKTSYYSDLHTWKSKVSFPVSAISGQAGKVICTFYINTEDKYGTVVQKILGTKELTIQTTAEMTQHMSIQNGDILYKYDGNGNSPFVADYAYPYQAKKIISDITFKVYKEDGIELNENEYNYCDIKQLIPKNSMIIQGKDAKKDQVLKGDYYEYSGKGIEFQSLSYNIENIQNPKKTNNYIVLTITFKDITLTEEINIKFVKEGESGTNGSAYTGMITFNEHTYDDINDLKVCRLQLIYVDDESSDKKGQQYNEGLIGNNPSRFSSLSFDVAVYCNGERIEDKDLYKVEQELFDSKVTHPVLKYENGEFKVEDSFSPSGEDQKQFCTIIAAKITVGDDGALYEQNEDKEIIYTYYPVEVIIIKNPRLIEGAFPYIAGGYSQVLYASDGTNPQFDSTNPFRVENDTSIINNYSDDYNYEQTSSSNIRTSNNGSIEYRGIPVNRYNSGESLNYIQVKIKPKEDEEGEITPPEDIVEKLNETKGKKNDRNKEINALKYLLPIDKGGTDNFLNTFFNHFINFKNNIMPFLTIDGMKKYLSDRQAILNKIEEIKKFIDKYENKLSKYKQDLQLLHNLRTKLQNIGVIFDLTENDLLEKNGFVGDGLSEKTKRQFDNYRKQIDDALKSFITKYKDSSIKDSFISLVNELKDEDRVVSFKSDSYTYEGFNIYTDLISLKETYYGIVNRLVAPNGSTEQEDNYAFISNYINIEDMINQINKIFTNLSEEKYKNDTVVLKEEKEKELAELETEIAGLEELKRYFIDDGFVIISRPIIMLYNRYELSNVIGQDGNKLYTGENDDYLLAPQIGAGRKEDDNSFTGLIMGIRNHSMMISEETKKANQVGLFGYDRGESTLFINAEDGSAIFGKSSTGQIIIDPSTDNGLIYSSTYQKKYKIDGKPDGYSTNNISGEGMLIDFTNSYIHLQNETYKKDDEGNYIDKDGKPIPADSDKKVKIKDPGRIYSGNHNQLHYNGDSNVPGFYIDRYGLSFGTRTFIGENGILRLGYQATKEIKPNEEDITKCQTIDGNTTCSYIAFGKNKKFDSSNLVTNPTIGGAAGEVYIGTNGIRLGNKFAVDNNGNLAANQIFAKGGTIGGQTIGESSLYSTKEGKTITIDSNGSINAGGGGKDTNGQSIDSNGNAYFKNITCNSVFSINDGTNSQSRDAGGTTNQSFGGTVGSSGSQTLSKNSFDISNGETPYMKMDSTQGLMLNGDQVRMYDVTGNPVLGTYIKNLAVGSLSANYVKTDELDAKIAEIPTLYARMLYCEGIYAKEGSSYKSAIITGEKRQCEIIEGGVTKNVVITIKGLYDE